MQAGGNLGQCKANGLQSSLVDSSIVEKDFSDIGHKEADQIAHLHITAGTVHAEGDLRRQRLVNHDCIILAIQLSSLKFGDVGYLCTLRVTSGMPGILFSQTGCNQLGLHIG